MKNNLIIIASFALILNFACNSDEEIEVLIPHEKLVFSVTASQREMIMESRDETYEITDPIPVLRFQNKIEELKKIKVRGVSASRVRRKSFSIDTEEFLSFGSRDTMSSYSSKDFKLLSLAYDHSYIENRIAIGLIEKADIFPLFYKYIEVVINEETNGIYLLVENPNDYLLDRNEHSMVIRRSYNGKIADYKYDGSNTTFSEEDYFSDFNKIYTDILNLTGEELFTELNSVLDLRQYMRKIAFDYLIKNGDYTDEIYFYDDLSDNQIRFQVMPWDYDDIFEELPHEINIDYGMGTAFGTRYYTSLEDIQNDIGDKIIFSIEDDLDYTIAKDEYLYSIYKEEVAQLLNIITEEVIQAEFVQAKIELSSFFADPEIIHQSTYDIDATSWSILNSELKDKKELLLSQRSLMLAHL